MNVKMETFIKEKRPTLSESSLKTYSSILKNIYKKVFGDEEINYEKYNNHEPFLEHLKDIECSKRKTILSALVVVTNNDNYREAMICDIKQTEYNNSLQEQNEKQKENNISKDEMEQIFKASKKRVTEIYKDKYYSNSVLREIQDYILLCLFYKMIAPRRAMDYIHFKIRNIDKDVDNYLDEEKEELVFNKYKTAKTYNCQRVKCPKKLLKVLQQYIKINPTDYLLFDSNNEPLNNTKLTQRLNKIFTKKFSINGLRHSYLSNKYQKTIETNRQLTQDLRDMGTSASQIPVYIQKI